MNLIHLNLLLATTVLVGTTCDTLLDNTQAQAVDFTFSGTVGSLTNLNGTLSIAFDTAGNLYATNSNNNTISEFNSIGTFVNSITGNLDYPTGIAFDNAGNLYAANIGDNTISEFN
ncbi:MAG: hypothetical protein JO235_00390 [Chroococcidiopsidaceae cyanobacterium CP_BM_RX_35]|nr:hypothetical protein [Chroococcidiopsidaceae cyanobacterium CP_BM_RX_35]